MDGKIEMVCSWCVILDTHAHMVYYNYDSLSRWADDNNIILDERFTTIQQKITRDTKISGNCITPGCTGHFEKGFRTLVVNPNGPLCTPCSKIKKEENQKNAFLRNHGVSSLGELNALPSIREKIEQTNQAKYGVKSTLQLDEVRKKGKITMTKKFGVEHAAQSEVVREKMRNTNIERRGTEYASQSSEVKKKIAETNNERYGNNSSLHGVDVHTKTMETWKKKYRTTHPMQSPDVQEKTLHTNQMRRGTDYPMQSSDVRLKSIETSMKKYGTRHPSQDPGVADNMSKKAYARKTFEMPSGRLVTVQGCEPECLTHLITLENISESDIVVERSNVPTVWWTDQSGKEHRYYVDIYIQSQNRMIECKSRYHYEKNKETITAKLLAARKLGYVCDLYICERKCAIEIIHVS